MNKAHKQRLMMFDGYLIHRIAQIYKSCNRDSLGEDPITPTQCAILFNLDGVEMSNQRTLAHQLGIDPGTMCQVIRRLISKELVVESESTEDRRVKDLRITAAGRELVQQLVPSIVETDERFSAGLTEEEHELLRKLLFKTIAHHDRYCAIPFTFFDNLPDGFAPLGNRLEVSAQDV